MNHVGCEVLQARWQEKDAMVAVIVLRDQGRSRCLGEVGVGRWACLCLDHDGNLEASAYPGFCDVWRHWRFSTRLSTPDSYGIQPCKLFQRHQVRVGYKERPVKQKGEPICSLAS